MITIGQKTFGLGALLAFLVLVVVLVLGIMHGMNTTLWLSGALALAIVLG